VSPAVAAEAWVGLDMVEEDLGLDLEWAAVEERAEAEGGSEAEARALVVGLVEVVAPGSVVQLFGNPGEGQEDPAAEPEQEQEPGQEPEQEPELGAAQVAEVEPAEALEEDLAQAPGSAEVWAAELGRVAVSAEVWELERVGALASVEVEVQEGLEGVAGQAGVGREESAEVQEQASVMAGKPLENG